MSDKEDITEIVTSFFQVLSSELSETQKSQRLEAPSGYKFYLCDDEDNDLISTEEKFGARVEGITCYSHSQVLVRRNPRVDILYTVVHEMLHTVRPDLEHGSRFDLAVDLAVVLIWFSAL